MGLESSGKLVCTRGPGGLGQRDGCSTSVSANTFRRWAVFDGLHHDATRLGKAVRTPCECCNLLAPAVYHAPTCHDHDGLEDPVRGSDQDSWQSRLDEGVAGGGVGHRKLHRYTKQLK